MPALNYRYAPLGIPDPPVKEGRWRKPTRAVPLSSSSSSYVVPCIHWGGGAFSPTINLPAIITKHGFHQQTCTTACSFCLGIAGDHVRCKHDVYASSTSRSIQSELMRAYGLFAPARVVHVHACVPIADKSWPNNPNWPNQA